MKVTELNEKIVKTILLKMIIIKELHIYNKIEGQCIHIYLTLPIYTRLYLLKCHTMLLYIYKISSDTKEKII